MLQHLAIRDFVIVDRLELDFAGGFSTLTGLVLYAAADPVDIRAVGPAYQETTRYSGLGLANRVMRALKEYF